MSLPLDRFRAQHWIALSLGIEPDPDPDGGSDCAVCGQASPFASAGSCKPFLKMVEVDDMPGAHPGKSICAGCVRCSSGRPGDDPPPLRTISFRVDLVPDSDDSNDSSDPSPVYPRLSRERFRF